MLSPASTNTNVKPDNRHLQKHGCVYTKTQTRTHLNSKDSAILGFLFLQWLLVYFWCSDTPQPEDVCKNLMVGPERMWKEVNARAEKKNRCGISEAAVNTIHCPWRWRALQLKKRHSYSIYLRRIGGSQSSFATDTNTHIHPSREHIKQSTHNKDASLNAWTVTPHTHFFPALTLPFTHTHKCHRKSA